MIKIYDRKNKSYVEEEQYGSKYLEILYNSIYGRMLLKIFINPITSNLLTLYKKSIFSKKQIYKLIDKYNIDIFEYEKRNYNSFNDFFTRKISEGKRIISNKKNDFISPCDSKLLVYEISKVNMINIKGTMYTLEELVKNKIDLSNYSNGLCLVFRLSMDDYHRYCFPDNGKIISNYKINGCLHTVSSISKDYKVYKENKREVSVLETENFSKLLFLEVGALLVGKINNHKKNEFYKGEEKGFFSLGGSTIIVFVQNSILDIDKDILKNSINGIETKVKYGEKIGVKVC